MISSCSGFSSLLKLALRVRSSAVERYSYPPARAGARSSSAERDSYKVDAEGSIPSEPTAAGR